MTYKVIEFENLVPDDASLLHKRVNENDCLNHLYPGTIITHKNKPIVIYGLLPKEFDDKMVRSALRNISYSKARRLTQYMNKTEVSHDYCVNFGYNPPNRVFGTSAGACLFNTKYPNWYKVLVDLGVLVAKEYERFNKKSYDERLEFLSKNVRSSFIMPGTPYTQGVINNNNMLGYHYDRDNIPNGWSCMVYFKRKSYGGNLAVPALKSKFICRDRAFMLFDGQSLLHGVTPIQNYADGGYRYSIVYYARESMVGLGSVEDELKKSNDIEFKKHFKNLEASSD